MVFMSAHTSRKSRSSQKKIVLISPLTRGGVQGRFPKAALQLPLPLFFFSM